MGTRGTVGDGGAVPDRLQVRLFGDVLVTLDGNRVHGFDAPRLQRILLQLSLHEGGRNRARLAYDLWPDSIESQARTNLRKLLHDLRRVLPAADEFVDIGSHNVRWRPGAPVSVDLVAFRSAVARGDLTEAADHYGGELLPACYDDWLLAERDRLRADAIDVLRRLAEQAVESGDDETAVAHARRLLTLDGFCEPAHRVLMSAHARRGDRAEALRVYHGLVEVLDRELGVEPDAATREAYEVLRAGRASRAPAGTGDPITPSLIGRDRECAVALTAWRAAAGSRATLLLVTGEAGIGKTRLVEELGRTVAAQGIPVARTRAYAAAGRPPWGPVVDWLRSEPIRARLDRLAPASVHEVSRLLPELRTADGSPAAATPSSDVAARHQLLDALSGALLAGGRPLLLVIDDLQWCDPDTVDLIGFLLRAAPDAPLLIAATVRVEELEDRRLLTRLRTDFGHDDTVIEMPLGRLGVAETAELAAGLTGVPPDAGTAERLWRDTEGNPLFVVEAVRTGMGSGSVRPPLSPTVQALISARLARLSPTARELVEVAATVGRAFTVDELAAASGAGDDVLVDALDELWQRQIVRERGTGYDFSHDRVREVTHDLISPARRRRIHGRVAQALATIHAADLGTVSSRLALHYEQAGQIAHAVDAYRRAGERSVHVVAFEDAIAAFRHALLLLETLPRDRTRDETELVLRIALGVPIVAREGYGSDAAQDVYERALALCRRLDRQVEPPVLRGLGLASLMECRFDRSSGFGEALLAHSAADPTATAEGHYLLGVNSFWRGDLGPAKRHLQGAIDTFPADHTREHLDRYGQDPRAVCLIRLAWAELWSGRPDTGMSLTDDALRRAGSLDHALTEGYVRMYAAILAAERDEPERLVEQLAVGEVLWSRQQLGYIQSLAQLLRGWLDVLADERGAVDRLAGSVDGWHRHRQTLHFSYGLTLLARAHLRHGNLDAGRRAAEQGIRWSSEHDQRYAEAELWRLNGELLALGGERDGAMECYRRALDVSRAQGARWLELRAACSRARLDHRAGARDLLAGVLRIFDEGHQLPVLREAAALVVDVR